MCRSQGDARLNSGEGRVGDGVDGIDVDTVVGVGAVVVVDAAAAVAGRSHWPPMTRPRGNTQNCSTFSSSLYKRCRGPEHNRFAVAKVFVASSHFYYQIVTENSFLRKFGSAQKARAWN